MSEQGKRNDCGFVTATRRAYAKVNLYLDVTAKRDDGYHDLRSIMQLVSLYDTVRVSMRPADAFSASVSVGGASLPLDSRNLAFRAAEAFARVSGERIEVKIHIDKRIPIAAGLAGGSADAAAVITALNGLCKAPLDSEKMLSLAASIGSDVPFCMLGGTRLCTGRGEITEAYENPPELSMVVAIGNERTSTPHAYAEVDKKYFGDNDTPREHDGGRFESINRALSSGSVEEIAAGMYNIFEDVMAHECPQALSLIRELKERGALAAVMSGSGPSVVALFRSATDARRAAGQIRGRVFAVKSV